MQAAISTQLTPANVARALDVLALTHSKLVTVSRGLSDAQLRRPLGKGERSMTEVVAHLLHSEARGSEAIYLALVSREPVLANVHSERQFGRLVR